MRYAVWLGTLHDACDAYFPVTRGHTISNHATHTYETQGCHLSNIPLPRWKVALIHAYIWGCVASCVVNQQKRAVNPCVL